MVHCRLIVLGIAKKLSEIFLEKFLTFQETTDFPLKQPQTDTFNTILDFCKLMPEK